MAGLTPNSLAGRRAEGLSSLAWDREWHRQLLDDQEGPGVEQRFRFKGGRFSSRELMLANGATVNLRNVNGETALQLALRMGNDAMSKLLRQHGAK